MADLITLNQTIQKIKERIGMGVQPWQPDQNILGNVENQIEFSDSTYGLVSGDASQMKTGSPETMAMARAYYNEFANNLIKFEPEKPSPPQKIENKK